MIFGISIILFFIACHPADGTIGWHMQRREPFEIAAFFDKKTGNLFDYPILQVTVDEGKEGVFLLLNVTSCFICDIFIQLNCTDMQRQISSAI